MQRAAPINDLALLRKKPVEWIASSTSLWSAPAKASGVGKRSNSGGVTRLTRSSVHCAERIVATSSSHGVRNVSEHLASGYSTRRRRTIARARAEGSLVRVTLAMRAGQVGAGAEQTQRRTALAHQFRRRWAPGARQSRLHTGFEPRAQLLSLGRLKDARGQL